MVGQTLAHYRILEKLGSGGMGDVYLAEDTKLDRKVALKVLPRELAENEERRARFQREAKAIAALNHPNIVTLHSVEEADSVHFITMELVDGKTLSELIPKRGLTPRKFFDIAVLLADAIATAHEAGIVHRDLKPANVMVTYDGRVKVLDFGLARYNAPVRVDGDSESPTALKTGEGVLAGTLHYMSPEQAEGRNVDQRTDIFSLGVIFYEMLTGRRPFESETPAGTLSAILKDEPLPVSLRRSDVSPSVIHVVNWCLEKNLRLRLQSARDLRNELETLREGRDAGELEPGPVPVKFWLVAVAVALAVGVAVGYKVAPPASGRSVLRVLNPRQVTFDVGVEDYPTWSPDGQQIAFSRGDGIYVMSPLAGDPRKVAPWTGNIVWSEDSRRIGYGIEDDTGGHFFETVDLETGESSRVAVGGDDAYNADISWSADERLLAFIEHSSRDNDVTRVAIANLDEDVTHAVTDGQSKAWSTRLCRDGSCVYYVANRTGIMDLWRQLLDDDGAPVGEPRAVTAGVGMRSATFSPKGDKLAYSKGARISNIWRVPILADRPASWADAEQLTVDQAHIESVDVSPDGNMVLYDSNKAGSRDLWVLRLDTGTTTRLTTHPAPDWGPILSPDGTEVAFYSKRGISRDVWIIPTEGGAPRQITDGEAQDNVFAWSPDGSRLAFASTRSGDWGIWTVDRNGGNETKLAEGGYTVGWSPDGQWLAFADFSREDGNVQPRRDRISVVPAQGGQIKPLTDEAGWAPTWSNDQETVYFVASNRRELWAVDVDSGGGRAVTALSSRSGKPGSYALATDGRYLYFTWEQDTGDIWVMDVVTDEDT